jgi:3-deoxy-D-manno-octulosonic-acid transferase
MFLLYTILYSIALIVIFPFEYFRRPAALKSRWLRERLGIISENADEAVRNRKTIWIHAVSVGEAAAAVPLVKRLKELHPGIDFFISTVTDTGQKVAAERMGHLARIVYVPFDLPGCITRTLRNIKPSLAVIMETELWPNIARGLDRQGIPILLVNGRISEKSYKGYQKARFFIRHVLECFSMFCMQEEEYALRIKALGALPDKVMVMGNLKFDMQPPAGIPEWTKVLKKPVIIAGSTHRTEEEIIIDAYELLLKEMPGLNLILAPRHPERFSEVEEIVRKRKLGYLKRSGIKGISRGPGTGSAEGVIVILDAIGELASVYAAADVVIIGGSFIPHGGQNPLEPAYWRKAIVCGPHMENFPFMDEFYAMGAAIRTEASGLGDVLNRLLRSEEKRAVTGMAARTFYEKNAGATDRAADAIRRYLA